MKKGPVSIEHSMLILMCI